MYVCIKQFILTAVYDDIRGNKYMTSLTRNQTAKSWETDHETEIGNNLLTQLHLDTRGSPVPHQPPRTSGARLVIST